VKLFRWKAIVPALLVLALVVVVWTLTVDLAVRRAIESAGSEVVGARVELQGARLRLRRADLVLTGLQVADPNAPMRNLVEVPEVRAALNGHALLMKKIVVESVVVRGVRFGTPRRTSGALTNASPTTGLVTRRVLGWINGIPRPTLDLEGLVGAVVRVPAISSDSLRTPRQARLVAAQGDSLRTALEAELRGLDPRPTADSARALVDRLRSADLRRMNPIQLASSASDVRGMIGRVGGMKARLDTAKAHADRGLRSLHDGVTGIEEARRADLTFVHGLVHLPSFDAPDVSMALFGPMVTERLKPLMYWVNLAEEYIPPGLDPRRRTGPRRLRRTGTTFDFPLAHAWPTFLVERAAADLVIGGRTAAAGSYSARITGATTEPAVYGRPMVFAAERSSTVGPRDLKVNGTMDRTGAVPRDSLVTLVPGVAIPAFAVPRTGASLDLGDTSVIELALARSGPELRGRWRLTSDAVHWARAGDSATATGPAPRIGSPAWAEALIWRSVAAIPRVEIVARISGPLASPRLALSSNVGDALADTIKRAMGAELERAESQVRARVDSLVAGQVAEVRGRVSALEGQVVGQLGAPRQQLAQLEDELNQLLRQVTNVVPGVRLPALPGIPRPGRP
jgi:uncharacterized protein (TIGR03545 family)